MEQIKELQETVKDHEGRIRDLENNEGVLFERLDNTCQGLRDLSQDVKDLLKFLRNAGWGAIITLAGAVLTILGYFVYLHH